MQNKQTQLVDFSTYFAKYANDEASRILWNADAQLVQNGQVEIDGTIYSIFKLLGNMKMNMVIS